MRRVFLCLVMICCGVALCPAQKINIGYIYPAGAQRGETLTIAIGGQSIATARAVQISGDGVTAEIIPPTPKELKAIQKGKKKKVISDEDNLQLAQNIKVRVTVSKDAELGIRDLKVIGANGAGSNRLYFEIGDYPDFVEHEPNNIFEEANHIAKLPATINGYVERCAVRGDMESGSGGITEERSGKDLFSFDAKQGEVIVAEVKARRFVPYLADAVPGWFQAVISMYDESGREVAYCDDFNLKTDPVLIHEVQRSGKYFIKIHDSIYRGREDFTYRINLGTIPYVTSLYPLGGVAGRSTNVELRGVNLAQGLEKGEYESVNTQVECAKEDRNETSHRFTNPKGYHSNEFLFEAQSGLKEIFEVENNKRGLKAGSRGARAISSDEVANGRIDYSGDEDWYVVDVKKGGMWYVGIEGRRLNSPIDAKITIYDSKYKMIEQADDVDDPEQGLLTHQADPSMSLLIKKLGRYYIRVTETQSKGGVEYAYRLRAQPAEQSFALNIEPSSLSIPQGGTSLLTLFVQRNNRFYNDIDLKFEGLPEGYRVSQTTLPRSAKSVKLAITAPKDAEVGALDLHIFGESKAANGKRLRAEAKPVEAMLQAFYITHLLSTDEFCVDIVPADPFRIRLEPIDAERIELREGAITRARVVVDRNEGYNEPIQIIRKSGIKAIKFPSITIAEGESEGVLELELIKDIKYMPSSSLMLLGTVKGSTNNRVAGQARNTIYATVMVNSEMAEIYFPDHKIAPKKEQWKPKTNTQKKKSK